MPHAYDAALFCDECAADIIDDCKARGIEDSGDSNDYPQWDSSSGESDCPEHCYECHEFLENPLTSDGHEYLRAAIANDIATGRSDSVAVTIWAPYYDIDTDSNPED